MLTVLTFAVVAGAGCGGAAASRPGGDVRFSGDIVSNTAVRGGSIGLQGAQGKIGIQGCRVYPAGSGYPDTLNYSPAPANYQADLRAVIGLGVYYLNIWVLPFTQPRSFPIQKPGRPFGSAPASAIVSLSDYGGSLSPSTSAIREWQALSGTVTVNRDERGGSIDVELGLTFSGTRPTMPMLGRRSLRIAGTWSCDK